MMYYDIKAGSLGSLQKGRIIMLRRKILTAVAAIGTTAMVAATPAMASDANVITNQKNKSYSQILWYNGRRYVDGADNGSSGSGIAYKFNPTGRSFLPGNSQSKESHDSVKKKGYAYVELVDRYTENDTKEDNGGAVVRRTVVRLTYTLNGKVTKSWDDMLSASQNYKLKAQILSESGGHIRNYHNFSLCNINNENDVDELTITPGQAVTVPQYQFEGEHHNSFRSYFNITPSDGFVYKGEERNCHGGITSNDNGTYSNNTRNPHAYKLMSFRPYVGKPENTASTNHGRQNHNTVSDKPSTLATPARDDGFITITENGSKNHKLAYTYGRNWDSEKRVTGAQTRINSCWLGITNQGFGSDERTYGNGNVNSWGGAFSMSNDDKLSSSPVGGSGATDSIVGSLSAFGGCGYTLRGIYHVTSTETQLDANWDEIQSGDYPTLSNGREKMSIYDTMVDSDGTHAKVHLPKLRNPKGYVFKGWKNIRTGETVEGSENGATVDVAPDGSVWADSAMGYSSPTVYQAKWDPRTLTIKYYANGGKINRPYYTTETYTDAQGNTKTKRVKHNHWIEPKTLDSDDKQKSPITYEYKYGSSVTIPHNNGTSTNFEGYTTGHRWYLKKTGYIAKKEWSLTRSGYIDDTAEHKEKAKYVKENDVLGGNVRIDGKKTPASSAQAVAKVLGGLDNGLNTQDCTIKLYAQWRPDDIKVYYNSNGGTLTPSDDSAGLSHKQKVMRTTTHKVGYYGGIQYSLSRDDYVFRNRWICSADNLTYSNGSGFYVTAEDAANATPDPTTFYADWNHRPWLEETDESTWSGGSVTPFTYVEPMENGAPNSEYMKNYLRKIVIQEGDTVNLMQFAKGLDTEDGDVSANDSISSTTYQNTSNSSITNGSIINAAYTNDGNFSVTYTTHDNDAARGGVTAETQHPITLYFHVNRKPEIQPRQETNYGNRLFFEESDNKTATIHDLKTRLISTDVYEDTYGVADGYPIDTVECEYITYYPGGANEQKVNNPPSLDLSKVGTHTATFRITDTMRGHNEITIPIDIGKPNHDKALDKQIRFISGEFINQILDGESSTGKDDYGVSDPQYNSELKDALRKAQSNYSSKTTVSESNLDLSKYYTLKYLRDNGYVTANEYTKACNKGTASDKADGKGRNNAYTDDSKIYYKDFIEIVGVDEAMKYRSLYTK